MCRGHGRVQLYLYPPSGPHRPVIGITLPLPLPKSKTEISHHKISNWWLTSPCPQSFGKPRLIAYSRIVWLINCAVKMALLPCRTTKCWCEGGSVVFIVWRLRLDKIRLTHSFRNRTADPWNTKQSSTGSLALLVLWWFNVARLLPSRRCSLTLIVLMWRIGWAHNNARK